MFDSSAGTWPKLLCTSEMSLNNYVGLIDYKAGKLFLI